MDIRIVILQAHFFLFCFISAAQHSTLDNLTAVLQQAGNDTARVNLLYTLGDSLWHTDPHQALIFGKQAFNISEHLKYQKGIGKAAMLIGVSFEKQGKYDSALYYYHISLETSKALNNKVNIGRSLNNIGIIYDLQGSYDQALDYYFQTLEIWRQANYYAGISISLNNIGIIYDLQGKYEKAVQYHEESLAICEKMNDLEGVSSSLHNLGLVYEDMKEDDKAISYYARALEIREEIGDQNLIANTLHGMGSVNLHQKKYDQALLYTAKSLEVFKKIGNVYGEMHALIGMADTYKAINRYQKALYYARKALALARRTNTKPEIRRVSKILADLYQQQNNYQKAFQYQSLYLAYNDSIFNLEKEKVINALELARKDAENEVLKKENELKKAQIEKGKAIIQQQSILVIAVSICLLLAGGIAFVLYYTNHQKLKHNHILQQQKTEITQINQTLADLNFELQEQHTTMRQQNHELERLNAFKDKLFSIISHDFRSPLSSLQGVINLLNANALTANEIKMIFDALSDKVRNTTGMLDNLLNWTRTQMQGIQVNPSLIDLQGLTEENVSLVKLSAYKKGIILENKITEPVKAYADAEMVKLVLRNLISNAIKFSALGDKVTISTTSNGEFVTVSVEDTGQGINEKNQQKLFHAGDYITFGTANEKGTGLGLILCKDFIEKNNGRIWVESQEKKGSIFNFTLPVHTRVFQHSFPYKRAALT